MLKIPRKHLKLVSEKTTKRGSKKKYKYDYRLRKKDGTRLRKKGTHIRISKH